MHAHPHRLPRTSAGRALIVTVLGLSIGSGQAQNTATPGATPASRAAAPQPRPEPNVQRLHWQDKGASVDELRVGGQTRRITVHPGGSAPAYEVSPTTGERSWRILGF